MGYQRPLDRLEISALNVPGTFYVEYRGKLNEDAMQRAISLTGRKFPILRAHVTNKNDSFIFSAPDEATVPILATEGDSSIFQRVAKEWDISYAVAQVTLGKNDTGGYMGLTTDHSAADGRAIFALLVHIWRMYTEIVDDCSDPVANNSHLPSSPVQIIEKFDLAHDYAESGEVKPANGTEIERLPLRHAFYRMGHSETSNLKRIAKKYGTTVHALVCGATLTAQRKHSGATESPTPMTCTSAVDLRRYVTAAMHPCDVTTFSAIQSTTVDVPVDGNPIDVGIAVRRRLTDGIANREPLINCVRLLYSQEDGPHDLTTTAESKGRISYATVSNLGALPDFPCPDEMKIADFHDVAYYGLEPNPTYIVYAHGGQMRIRFTYQPDLFSGQEMEKVWSSVKVQLEEMAKR